MFESWPQISCKKMVDVPELTQSNRKITKFCLKLTVEEITGKKSGREDTSTLLYIVISSFSTWNISENSKEYMKE